ncbi:flagellin [Pantoea sp. 18069]|uniref:flagellin N-terminal helical domain-containing protein n=1 Tax=Pantoea sp. 18069 TaxID=2681415 RepID=UPI00135A974C|nr:flagellin [Pantoea sp. 18069]
MAATINTNIASINAQRNLSLSGSSLATSMQRLSSGLRVNSAKDDAAGLAISERMNTQIKGLTVAARNANDGISLAQTAEGALGKVGDMLQRMRELAVQASNATNSASDRVALQAEVTQLAAEIDRVAKQTNFNGQKIIDGSFAGAVFQVGANSGDNVTLGALADTRSSQVSNISYGASSLAGINALNTDDATPPAINDFADPIAKGDLKITIGTSPNSLTIDLEAIEPANSSLERLGQVVNAINNKSADTGVTVYMAKVEGTSSYEVRIMSEKLDASGAPVEVDFGTGFSATLTGISPTANITAANAQTNIRGIDEIDVTTQPGAWVALKKIDSAIDQINGARATLGAMQSRFETAVSNIDIQVENLSAARGRIVDADFAKETANLSRTQILQQAGTAMVAQANQLPQQVLQLLQG